MPLNTTGSNPIVIVNFGERNVIGECSLSFQSAPLNTPAELIDGGEFNTNTAYNELILNPKTLLDHPNNNVGDLEGCFVGWSVFLYSFVEVIPLFTFTLKIQQSGNDLIDPVVVNQNSDGVVSDGSGGNKVVLSFANFRQIV